MKKLKLKKKSKFSLIALLLCCVLLYSANNIFGFTGMIDKQVDLLKEKEMKFIYGERNILGDRYTGPAPAYKTGELSQTGYNLSGNYLVSAINGSQTYMQYQNTYIDSDEAWIDYIEKAARLKTVSEKLKTGIEKDSFRDKKLGIYYVFDFDYTMGALRELDSAIEKVSAAQKVPKALIAAVLFREMMFMGQEDLLDGLPWIGGKSMGICQIGVENARYNENTVHGEDSYIVNDTDEEIKDMLQNPEQAVYFCAAQLKARAITLTGRRDVDLNKLNATQLHGILADYNQSKVKITIGPIKTKQKYAEETYTYFKLFSEYYELESK